MSQPRCTVDSLFCFERFRTEHLLRRREAFSDAKVSWRCVLQIARRPVGLRLTTRRLCVPLCVVRREIIRSLVLLSSRLSPNLIQVSKGLKIVASERSFPQTGHVVCVCVCVFFFSHFSVVLMLLRGRAFILVDYYYVHFG